MVMKARKKMCRRDRVKTLLHTLFYGAAVFLNLSYDVAHASSIRILEDSILNLAGYVCLDRNG